MSTPRLPGRDGDDPGGPEEEPRGSGGPTPPVDDALERERFRTLMRGSSARDVLARLVSGDPLDLRALCDRRQNERAVLIDPRRFQLRTAARIAHAAARYDVTIAPAVWIERRLEEALQDLVEEDRSQTETGDLPAEPWEARILFLADALGVEPALARRACAAFNQLPDATRKTAWCVMIEGKSVHRCVAEGHGPPKEVERRLLDALTAMHRATERGPSQGDTE